MDDDAPTTQGHHDMDVDDVQSAAGSQQDAGAADDMDVSGAPNGATSDVPVSPTTTAAAAPAPKAAMDVPFSKLDEDARKYLVEQTHEIIIPSYAAWFDMNAIHDVERRALPEFFNGRNKSKSPAIYKEYRDFMVNAYRLNPTEYLTVTACRRNLAGDVCAILRVHAFLEQWGLINYHVDPETRPAALAPPFTGHFRVTADTPRGLQPFLPAMNAPSDGSGAAGPNGTTATTTTATAATVTTTTTTTIAGSSSGDAASTTTDPANLASRRDIYTLDLHETSTASTQTYQCLTCGVVCAPFRYHSLKHPDVNLCEPCYFEGRFPSTMFAGDFVKLDQVVAPRVTGDQWTDQELLLLLEGIEMHDKDWSAISAHVGTKTRDQCILQFLKVPIEDPYLGVPAKDLGPLQFHRNAFNDVENPILSLVAFLSSAVSPHVAKAVTEAARASAGPTRGGQASTDVLVPATAGGENAAAAMDEDVAAPAADAAPAPAAPAGDKDAAMGQGDAQLKSPTTATLAASSDVPAAATSTDPTSPVNRATLDLAGGTALGLAAVRATELANDAEAEMRRVMAQVLDLQSQKMERKVAHFEQLEAMLDLERRELERAKQALYLEKLAWKRHQLHYQQQHPHAPHAPTSPAETLTVRHEVGAGEGPSAQQQPGRTFVSL
ncbi:hypothetical protein AMAG_01762 [Allomyces macrogynus ATCC 38327]|uniref:SWIRM-domain-containing protein n=1 Tax=Allomyces macrogynus (strain ATCC 38327) TaxID=578462 RepID=A0A0L0S003_ALLM3|nr:hypothetical protein AMAG_01762 [Allomyces macrogynus ATCC 38327]|eukprot:KNE55898.1 hypothetical protein AMAG_01762 [Allomyces macrogynus ATCC 38327]